MADDALPARVEWISTRVCALLKGKPDAFAKLYATEEGGDLINQFMNSDACQKLFFLSTTKEMTVCEMPPPANKKKVRRAALPDVSDHRMAAEDSRLVPLHKQGALVTRSSHSLSLSSLASIDRARLTICRDVPHRTAPHRTTPRPTTRFPSHRSLTASRRVRVPS